MMASFRLTEICSIRSMAEKPRSQPTARIRISVALVTAFAAAGELNGVIFTLKAPNRLR